MTEIDQALTPGGERGEDAVSGIHHVSLRAAVHDFRVRG